jgi:hypothetical protein
MSIYYSPELVRQLMTERIQQAQEALNTPTCHCGSRLQRIEGRLNRFVSRRSAPVACSC